MDPDATVALPPEDRDESKDVFRIGEETILKMQDQLFTIDDYGTRMNSSAPVAVPGVTEATEPLASDPLTRIEQKLDSAVHAIEALQRRIDSLDATIARMVVR